MTILNPERRESWAGSLQGRERGRPTITLRAPIDVYSDGTYAIRGLTSGSQAYWVKVLGNPQGDQVLVNELVVSSVGELIGAPVRPTALVSIPEALAGWKYGPAHRLRPGIAHGSLHLASAEENDDVKYERRDHNHVRRAGLVAIWDWCMGDDPQWLYDQGNEFSIWSFDHGFWLGGGAEEWTGESLAASVDRPWQWPGTWAGIDAEALVEIADRLRAVTPEQLLEVLARVPPEWGTADRHLESLGWFLYTRAQQVAERVGTAQSGGQGDE